MFLTTKIQYNMFINDKFKFYTQIIRFCFILWVEGQVIKCKGRMMSVRWPGRHGTCFSLCKYIFAE